MKSLQAAIICFVAFALSGCATGYYQRGYAGYNTGYTVQRYYDYDRSYYRPGTGFSYGQYYVQPSYGHERREHEHHQDWRQPVLQFNHHGGERGWQDRDAGRDSQQTHHRPEQAPQWTGGAQPQHQQHEHGFGGHRAEGEREHGGRHHGGHSE